MAVKYTNIIARPYKIYPNCFFWSAKSGNPGTWPNQKPNDGPRLPFLGIVAPGDRDSLYFTGEEKTIPFHFVIRFLVKCNRTHAEDNICILDFKKYIHIFLKI
jgi:hypothetical protein